MKGHEAIELIRAYGEHKEVVLDNCNGSVSLLKQVAELTTDDKPPQHYIAMVFDDND